VVGEAASTPGERVDELRRALPRTTFTRILAVSVAVARDDGTAE
jgi:hypothetical protein